MRATTRHQVVLAAGGNISFGLRQTDFLQEQGHIERSGIPGLWHSELTVDELHVLVWSNKDLRECDFCSTSPAPWEVECTPFQIETGPNQGGSVGGPARPMTVCDGCVRFVRSGERKRLIEYAIDAVIERARESGDLTPGVSKRRARAAILGPVTEIVRLTMDHATGRIDRA